MNAWGRVLVLLLPVTFASGCELIRSFNPCFAVDCPDGEVCEDGECVTADACEEDNDCDDNFVCDNGNCVAGECTEDEDCIDDCALDDECVCNADHECVECIDAGDCSDNNACTTDNCGSLTNRCVHTAVPCTSVGDCPAGCNASCTNLLCSASP